MIDILFHRKLIPAVLAEKHIVQLQNVVGGDQNIALA